MNEATIGAFILGTACGIFAGLIGGTAMLSILVERWRDGRPGSGAGEKPCTPRPRFHSARTDHEGQP